MSPQGCLQEGSLSGAQGSAWGAGRSRSGHPEHPLPSLVQLPLVASGPLVWDLQYCAFLECSQPQAGSLLLSWVSERASSNQTLGPPHAGAQVLRDLGSNRVPWFPISCGGVSLLGWIWARIHPYGKHRFVCLDGESTWFMLLIITALGIILPF